MQTRNTAILLGVILAAGVAAVIYFRVFAGPAPEKVIESIHSALVAVQTSEDEALLELGPATGFDWDELYVFGPYTAVDRIGTALAGEFSQEALSGISERDDIALLVFKKSGRAVALVPYPRARGDFAASSRLEPISRDNALFELIPLASDANWVNLSLTSRQVAEPD